MARVELTAGRVVSQTSGMPTLNLVATDVFVREYRKAGVPLQNLAEGAVQDLQRLAESAPTTWRRRYDRVAGAAWLQKPVLEIDLAGGPRMLAIDAPDALVLWRMGGHDLIGQLTRDRPPPPSRYVPLPAGFVIDQPSRLFPVDAREPYQAFGNEMSAEWIYWLDEQQAEVAERVANSVESAWLEGTFAHHALLGGPGTGKTTILVALLKRLSDLHHRGAALDVRLLASDRVTEQIERSTGWDLSEVRFDAKNQDCDVLLIDDPASLDRDIDHALGTSGASVVFGVDPLQMDESITDAELFDTLQRWAVSHYWLGTCYRQKRVVGAAAKHVADAVAASSPFLRKDKIGEFRQLRTRLTEGSNDVEFVNPSGKVETIEHPRQHDWEQYLNELSELQRAGRLWQHWPSLLVVADPNADVPEALSRSLSGFDVDYISTEALETAKGLEYQHVLLLLGDQEFSAVNFGFEGSGQKEYARFRLFRIPFSRAKDSLTTFVFPNR